MQDQNLSLDDVKAILERTPATVRALLEGLPDKWIMATERDGAWSPFDVLGHLIHGEQTDWMVRARHILSGETRPFATFDRTAQFTESKGKSLGELLTTFTRLRQQNLAELCGMKLADDDLSRKGLHPELGEVTLGQLLSTWVAHDLDHIVQIARTMAKVCTESTGPWHIYLSVLRDRRQ